MAAPRRILLLGATGQMGRLLTREMLATEGLSVRTMLRTDVPRRAETIARLRAWRNLGLDIVPGDVCHASDIDEALRGVTAVLSALRPGEPRFREAHARLFDAMVRLGVDWFIPSEFCWDLGLTSAAQADAVHVLRESAARGLSRTRLLAGLPIEDLFDRPQRPGLIQNGVVPYWGDDEVGFDLTSMRDVAKFAAAAVRDDGARGLTLHVAGDRRTMRSLARVLSRHTPHAVRAQYRGTPDHLAALVAEEGRSAAEGPRLRFHQMVTQGDAVFDRIDNGRYPWILTESVVTHWGHRSAPSARALQDPGRAAAPRGEETIVLPKKR